MCLSVPNCQDYMTCMRDSACNSVFFRFRRRASCALDDETLLAARNPVCESPGMPCDAHTSPCAMAKCSSSCIKDHTFAYSMGADTWVNLVTRPPACPAKPAKALASPASPRDEKTQSERATARKDFGWFWIAKRNTGPLTFARPSLDTGALQVLRGARKTASISQKIDMLEISQAKCMRAPRHRAMETIVRHLMRICALPGGQEHAADKFFCVRCT
jgi:hypothetical protein